MHIYWYGLSSFKIVSKDLTIFTDPYSKSTGLTPPRGAGNIVMSSLPDNEYHGHFSTISGEPFIVQNPGEYDIKEVYIHGIPVSGSGDKKGKTENRTVYNFSIEGMNVGFLGAYPDKEISETEEEEMNDVDILLVPCGGGDVLGAKNAVEIVNQLEPKVVIPMHYKIPGLKMKLDPVDVFLREIGGKNEEMDKLLIKKNDLQDEKTQVVILKPQRS